MRSLTRRARILAPVTALVLVGGLAACSSGDGGDGGDGDVSEQQKNAEAVYDKYKTITGADREAQLLEEAIAAGGEITVYTSNSAIDDIIDGFENTYDITVNTYRATPAAFLQRFFQEQEAGYYGVDVIEDADAVLITEQGLAGTYVNDELTSTIRGFEEAQGKFIPTRGGVVVTSWNTDKVNESEIPDTLEGFTDPKWKGRLSMTDADWPWYMTLSKQWVEDGTHTQEETDEIFQTLASYSTIVPSHTLQAQLLAAGEFDIALTTFNHSVDLAADDGAPVTWKKADGSISGVAVYGPEGAVPIINAPNPAGALLFIDYMLTGAQEIMAGLHRPTSVPQADDPFDGVPMLFWDMSSYLTERDDWESKYLEFMKAGTPTS
jgi:iron(III) transport system substrate-binding protein